MFRISNAAGGLVVDVDTEEQLEPVAGLSFAALLLSPASDLGTALATGGSRDRLLSVPPRSR
jgi:hypothetical protein